MSSVKHFMHVLLADSVQGIQASWQESALPAVTTAMMGMILLNCTQNGKITSLLMCFWLFISW